MKKALMLIIASIVCFNIFAIETQNITGASGSFTLTSQQYVNNYEVRYNINTGTQKNVRLSIDIDTEKDWDILFVYECDNNFSNLIQVKTLSGKEQVTYTSMSTNGKLVLKFIADSGTCGENGYNGYTVNYTTVNLISQSIPSNNSLSTSSTVQLGEETGAPNLHIVDRSSKNIGGIGQTGDYNQSMILLESEHNAKLGLSYNKISTSEAFNINSDESLLLSSKSHNIKTSHFAVTTPHGEEAFVVESSGLIKTNKKLVAYQNISTTAGHWIGVGGKTNQPYQSGHARIYMLGTDQHAYIDFKDNLNFRADKPHICPLSLQGDGNVAIGFPTNYASNGSQYQTEGHKLAIKGSTLVKGDLYTEGTIRADEILVEAKENWPDFVFEEDYDLKDLTEVESFILANKHLPDIPSSAQMEEQGVNLAEMNKLLLQKVEELTLYAIQQKAEAERQKEERKRETEKQAKKTAQLEERLEQLEKLMMNNLK